MHYERNFLTAVVVRVDFEPIQALSSAESPEWSARIRTRFPAVSSKPIAQLTVNVGPGGSAINHELRGMIHEHKVASDQPLPTVTLSHNFVAIDYGKAYLHFDRFTEDAEVVFRSFEQLHADAIVTRIGLRYINEFVIPQGNALDWENLLNPALMETVRTGIPEGMRVARSMHQLQAFNEDATMLMHYGLANPDFPGEVVRRQFVLDLDAFKEGPMSPAQIIPCVQTLNKICERAFESSIRDGMRELMGVINDEAAS